MYKHVLFLAALAALAACGNNNSSPNPVNGNDPGAPAADPIDGVEQLTIPEELAINVTGIGFSDNDPDNPLDDVLTVEGLGQDNAPFTAVYTRNPALDVEGYSAFSSQDDRLDRMYVAIAGEGPRGEVRAGSVADGGQFNRFFLGNFYERRGRFTRPDVTERNGLVSYAGLYAGVTNLGDLDQDQRLPLETDDPIETAPQQPRQTTGKVFLNVDFADNQVNGTIYDRQFTDGKSLASLDLINAELNENGEFIGEVEFSGSPETGGQGSYGGILGGENASAVAGVIALDNIFNPEEGDPEDSDFDREVGTFVLPRCGSRNASDICDGLGDL